MSDIDAWISHGVYDPAEPAAAQRLELLRWLIDQQVPLDEIVEAARVGQLTSVAGDRALRPGLRLTMAEVSAASGMHPAAVAAVHRASGMPTAGIDDAVYTVDDLEMFSLFKIAADFFSDAELIHFVRVLGSSLRRIAEAASEMFLRDVEAPIQEGGASAPLDVAKANLAGVQLARGATGVFDPMFRAHLEAATATTRRARADTHDYATTPLTIGFVDLSGFTTRSGALDPQELLRLVMTFESVSLDLISARGGRLVKLIGDEVMFSVVEPAEACIIAQGIVDQACTWAAGARGGVAHGLVIASGGDVYGETVNLASRITDIAVPGEVLVNEAVVQRADSLAFLPAGRRQLKGFAEPVRLWSLDV